MMDPNAALNEIRKQLKSLLSNDPGVDVIEAAMGLAEHTQALDDWLGKGGFLPAAWNRQTLIWTLEGDTLADLAGDATSARRFRVSVDWGEFKWDADNTGWVVGIEPDSGG